MIPCVCHIANALKDPFPIFIGTDLQSSNHLLGIRSQVKPEQFIFPRVIVPPYQVDSILEIG